MKNIYFNRHSICSGEKYRSSIHIYIIQSTLPKSNPLGLKKLLRLRENLTYEGSKTIENEEEELSIHST